MVAVSLGVMSVTKRVAEGIQEDVRNGTSKLTGYQKSKRRKS